MPSLGRILIVEDDSALRRAVQLALQRLGFLADVAPSGEAALQLLPARGYDVLLLDINMAGMGGVRACREIRQHFPQIGILMLTVRDSEEDKIAALDAGADDYITKPFHLLELAARIRSAVRRARAAQPEPDALLCIGALELDLSRRVLRKLGVPVHLTPKEFDLLRYLMEHAGRPVMHARLLRAVWGPEYGGELEYLRTFVRQLRRKIEDDPREPRYLLTDTHFGYRFADAAVPELREAAHVAEI